MVFKDYFYIRQTHGTGQNFFLDLVPARCENYLLKLDFLRFFHPLPMN